MHIRPTITLIAAWFAVSGSVLPANKKPASVPPSPPPSVTYVAGSSAPVCELTGAKKETKGDPTHGETGTPTVQYGLVAADLGYGLTYENQRWFLFGDAVPVATRANEQGRWSAHLYKTSKGKDKSLVNDAIAYQSNRGNGCPDLTFVSRAPKQFADPSLTWANKEGHVGGRQVSLRTNEAPIAGVGVGRKMYVVFTTDNPGCKTAQQCATSGLTGYPTRSVLGVVTDPQRGLKFKALYDFSTPARRWQSGARFVFVDFARGSDGWLYVYGTAGGNEHRHSQVFLARARPGRLDRSNSLQYFTGFSRHGIAMFSNRNGESAAVPLFHDSPPCAGDVGVEQNSFVDAWVMVYTCDGTSGVNPPGIWMRTAPDAWGPWSQPQTIFNAGRDHGFCSYIHSAKGCNGGWNAGRPSNKNGASYGSHIVPGWTTGFRATKPLTRSTSIFFFSLDTFNPYGEVIMRTQIEGPILPKTGPNPPLAR